MLTDGLQRCFACVEDQLDQDAVKDEHYEDPRNAFVTPDHSNENYPDYFTTSTATNPSEAVSWIMSHYLRPIY